VSVHNNRSESSGVRPRVKIHKLYVRLNELAALCHHDNMKWWTHPKTGKPLKRNKGELIALMHSELSEMLEGVRKDKMDEHIPHRRNEDVEAADLLIRLLDYCGAYGIDIDGAFRDKRFFNLTRPDHSHEARRKAGGKKF